MVLRGNIDIISMFHALSLIDCLFWLSLFLLDMQVIIKNNIIMIIIINISIAITG